jgi:hypothetical protein
MADTLSDDPWLSQFPLAGQHYIRAWFSYGVSQGAQTADGVLQIVGRVCGRKLEWSMSTTTEQLCKDVLLALMHQRPLAEAYAQTLLEERREKRPGDPLR